MGKGSRLEGKSLEIGGLIQQDTDGDIEHLREGTTYQTDGGKDYTRIVNIDSVDYREYINKLKEKKE